LHPKIKIDLPAEIFRPKNVKKVRIFYAESFCSAEIREKNKNFSASFFSDVSSSVEKIINQEEL
jgi:hypothetical protein